MDSVTCQCGSISSNERAAQVGDVGNGRGWRRAKGIWKISVPSSQFSCESKTALKKSVTKRAVEQAGGIPCASYNADDVADPLHFTKYFLTCFIKMTCLDPFRLSL